VAGRPWRRAQGRVSQRRPWRTGGGLAVARGGSARARTGSGFYRRLVACFVSRRPTTSRRGTAEALVGAHAQGRTAGGPTVTWWHDRLARGSAGFEPPQCTHGLGKAQRLGKAWVGPGHRGGGTWHARCVTSRRGAWRGVGWPEIVSLDPCLNA
jgi:hypothetical protein